MSRITLRWTSGVDLIGDGPALLGGSPLRLFRLTGRGAETCRRWLADGELTPGTDAEVRLAERLVDAGLAEPFVASPAQGVPAFARWPEVTAVVPVRDRPADLDTCVAALAASGVAAIVVVDDGSVVPVDAAHLAGLCGPVPVEVVRRATSGGPGAARTAGLGAVRTPLVALVDSDVVVTPSWLAPLVPLFDDDRLAIVAPRVSSGSPLGSAIDRYEWSASPLDLGAAPGRVGRDRRITYVPAAALVVRRSALAEVGAFDESMRVGEDVDLLWRLDAAGWVCRYEPAARVDHAVRPSWRALVRQRVGYGRSAAALDARHPSAVAPVVLSRWSAAVWALVVSGHPWLALALAGWTGRALDRKLRPAGVTPARSLRLVIVGHLGAGGQLARAALRPWAPLSAIAALMPGRFGRRARRVLAVSVATSVLREHRRRRPTLALHEWAPRWLADELAYTAGVWTGVVRHRRFSPLIPRLSD